MLICEESHIFQKFNIRPPECCGYNRYYDATNWLISRSDELGIDTSTILLSGSSSGAISVLTAEFERKNDYPESDKLPPGFQYAGIISFSGAILSVNGKLKYSNKPAPKMMFHGTADRIDPQTDRVSIVEDFMEPEDRQRVEKWQKTSPYSVWRRRMGHEVPFSACCTIFPEIWIPG